MITIKTISKKLSVCVVSILLIQGLSDCKSTSLKSSKTSASNISTGKAGISRSKNPADYAIRASSVGGESGAVIEKYMENQVIQLRQDLAGLAQIERLGEGIKITLNSAILFKDSSYSLLPDHQDNLKKVVSTLGNYKDTEVLVAGHTSSVGDEKRNQELSKKRAESLADFMQAHGISQLRIVTQGFGENTPKVSNNTESGRRQNERVELAIIANPTLKKQAEAEAAALRVGKK